MKHLIILLLLICLSGLNAQINRIAYDDGKCGLNFFAKSTKVTTREPTPPGAGLPVTFNISELQNCYRIEAAFLWWEVSYAAGSNPAPTATVIAPDNSQFTFPSVLLGQGGHKCWGEAGTRSFRADVTNSIRGNGNYRINTGTVVSETDGVTLIVIYRDLQSNFYGELRIDDGLITDPSGNTQSTTMNGISLCGPSGNVSAFMIVSDLQRQFNPGTNANFIFNGTPISRQVDFWDFELYQNPGTINPTTYSFGMDPGADCYSIVLTGIYSQTTTCFTCPERLNVTATASDLEICAGETVTIDANGAITYQWTSNPAGFNSSQKSVTFSPSATADYTVVGTSADGCVNGTATVRVTVNPNPIIDAGNDQTICAGSPVQIGNPATAGTPPFTYQWSPPVGLSDPSAAQPFASPDDTTKYYVTVIDSKGCTDIDSVIVNARPAPTANAGNDVEICFGSSTTIGQTATGGTPPYIYLWSPSAGLSDINIAQPEANPTNTTMYVMQVTDLTGCINLDTIIVIVNPLPVINLGSDQEICFRDIISIGSNVTSGTTPFTYLWTPATGLSATNTAFVNASPQTTTDYELLVTDTKGCTTRDTIKIIVNPLPQPVITADGPTTFCSCDSVILDAGGPFTAYRWSTNATTRTITVRDPGNYTVTVTDDKGCINTSPPIPITVIYPAANVILPPDTTKAEPGQLVNIPLYIESSNDLDFCNVRNFTATIRYRKSLLVPKGNTPIGQINGDDRTILLTGSRVTGDSILFNMQFLATLGDMASTPIEIESFEWTDCPFTVNYDGSEFALNGLCYDNGNPRLFMDKAPSSQIEIAPNPANSRTKLYLDIRSENPAISIHDALGKEIISIPGGQLRTGEQIIDINTEKLLSGIYFVILRTQNETITRVLEVGK
jgi:hypothetical protein